MDCGEGRADLSASLIALKPLLDEDGQSYLPLVYTFSFGQNFSVNQDSALVRPFHKALKESKPVGTISYAFYMESERFYILGSLANSPGGKIIFFPGTIDNKLVRTSNEGEILSKGILHNIDHISLEPSFRVYHVTLKEKSLDGSKYPRSNTVRVKDDIFLWFTMAIRDQNILEPAPDSQEIKIKSRDYADLKRKFKWIEGSRGGCKFNITCVDGSPTQSHYINFEFFISPTRHEMYAPKDVGVYHLGLSTYGIETDPREEIITRLHYVDLKGFGGSLWIRVSKIIGKLEQDYVLMMR